ncbi:PREDICTED: uncharacterized protein LOC109158590 [Ipomoea nil]|uniref:uncharacterized protein LOC109158590 n=1 Tax=Ipomoea nil TaxID=35883 RepID=UPI000901E216|nr:PREDICTED: uncharacterized protein LOC109158590 [Ipomoea nil]
MICIIWNCQGAGGREFHRVLRLLIETHRPSLVGLVEPKVSGSQANAICTKFGFDEWVRVEAVGFSGGIWILWDKAIQVQEGTADPWHMAIVYGSPVHYLRKRLWSELQAAKRAISGPWLVAGDFNAVTKQEETLNYTDYSTQRNADFVDWIHSEGLIDMGFCGPRLTWAELVKWNKEVFGSIEGRKKNLLNRIGGIQRLRADQLHRGLHQLENKLKGELEEVLYQEELMWFQRSREEWIVSGDRNTKFYHAATMVRRARNKIRSLKDDTSEWINEGQQLQQHVHKFFSNLFREETPAPREEAVRGRFPTLNSAAWRVFNRKVTIDEVKTAVFDMNPMKAPGPDGYHAAFYQQMWDIVGASMFDMVEKAFETGKLQEHVNDTLLVLIPKVQMPETIKQFRPISLCNVSYKVITKTITNRLKFILPGLVGPFQSSFVPGRQITDNVLVFQEVMHTMRTKRGKTGLMAIKIDLEKAYDRLSWKFINETLIDAGFESAWAGVIMECVQTANMSIVWNGTRLESFKPQRGVRQGDAMSPALFVLCMERLSQAITEEVANGAWKGIRLANSGPILSHLCFADDMVLFSEASVDQVAVIKGCLDRFCAASGQRVSLIKSQVFFSKNTSTDLAAEISTALNIPETKDLGRYLGVPSIHGRITQSTHGSLIERVAARLEGWKTKTLTFAGRVTLAKSVISAMPTYTMQSMWLPMGICDKLEGMIRRFIWGGDENTRKISLVRWDKVTQRKSTGGLGLRNLREVNSAFMAKLGWRMKTEPHSLWSQVLHNKYGALEDTRGAAQGRRASNAWRGMCAASHILDKGITRIIRNGHNTRFWMDRWVNDQRLYDHLLKPLSLPELYANVADLWEPGVGWRWNMIESVLPAEWKARISAHIVLEDDEEDDTWGWSKELNGRFSVSSAYALLGDESEQANDRIWEAIWAIKIPNKMIHFLWLVKHGKVLTNVERNKRHFTSDNACSLCAGEPETLLHIFRDCKEMEGLWESLLPHTTTQLLRTKPWKDWLSHNLEADGRMGFPDGWRETFGVAVWWCWRWRNDRVFEGKCTDTHRKRQWIKDQDREIRDAVTKRWSPILRGNGQNKKVFVWDKPADGWIKLNVDGCCKGREKRAGCGGVLRDTQGNWRRGFSHNIGACEAKEAEAWAILVGLRMAAHYGASKIVVESDSIAVIRALNSGYHAAGRWGNIMKVCKRASSHFEKVEFSHIVREQNRVADKLADHALTHAMGSNWFEQPPGFVRELLWRDRYGERVHRPCLSRPNGV